MKLNSSFRESYDVFWDGQGETFNRIGGAVGLSRPQQHEMLERAGYRVPPRGGIWDVLGHWWEEETQWIRWVVAYEDEMAHCAEGKILVDKENGLLKGSSQIIPEYRKKVESLYCTAFVGKPYLRPSVSWRHLQIGRKVVWLECKSTESWMSNYGDGSWEIIGEEEGYHPYFNYPLFAIDFVLGREMWAIDFNTAPGMRGTGVEDKLGGREIVRLIEGWHRERQ